MTTKERAIKTFFTMSKNELALIIYRYHIEMQCKKGLPVKGHKIKGAHCLKDTAKDFCMSIGRASQLISIAQVIIHYEDFKDIEELKTELSLIKRQLKKEQ